MAEQLSSIQTHLWVITGLICLFILIVLCLSYALFNYKRDKRRLHKLSVTGKFSDLLAMTDRMLSSEPENNDARVYKAIALYGLDRFGEARSVANELFRSAPLSQSEALEIINAIDRAEAEA